MRLCVWGALYPTENRPHSRPNRVGRRPEAGHTTAWARAGVWKDGRARRGTPVPESGESGQGVPGAFGPAFGPRPVDSAGGRAQFEALCAPAAWRHPSPSAPQAGSGNKGNSRGLCAPSRTSHCQSALARADLHRGKVSPLTAGAAGPCGPDPSTAQSAMDVRCGSLHQHSRHQQPCSPSSG